MKLFTALLVLFAFTGILATVSDRSTLFYDFGAYQRINHPFGGVHYTRNTPAGSESHVFLPENGFMGHQEHLDDYREAHLFHQRNPEVMQATIQDAILTCDEEHKADYLKFFPTFIGALTPSNSSFTFSAPCWRDNTVQLNIVDDTTVEVIHTIKNASAFGCGDTYFLSTLKNFHTTAYLEAGVHKTTFTVNAEELQLVKTTGMLVFRTCDKLKDVIPDALKTVYLFMGEIALATGITNQNKSVPTKFDVEQSIEFVKEATGYVWLPRDDSLKNLTIDIDESLVNSGDFFAVRKFDGTGNLVEYGTGAHVNHCTVALRVNGTLYIAESNANFEWPVGGIQMNPYQTWIGWAKNQGYQVTWLPLKKEFAQKFDSDTAYAFFKQYEGVPYGIHNYIWGWLDTPDHSYPPLLPPEFFGFMFAFLENIKPEAADNMYTQSMNKRLGTENLTIPQIAEEAYNRGLTLPDLYGMPEQDGWLYGGNVSYVCSAFVTAILKAGGLFGDNDVNAVEFTPRDVYQLEFYDPSPVLPEACTSVDPKNPYCQIMGQYIMDFPSIGTVKAYAHMNEKCWSEPPLYEIYPPGC